MGLLKLLKSTEGGICKMPRDDQGPQKPSKTYWLINGVLLAVLSVIFLLDVFIWGRFSASMIWFLLTGGMSVWCYVQFKSVGEKREK